MEDLLVSLVHLHAYNADLIISLKYSSAKVANKISP